MTRLPLTLAYLKEIFALDAEHGILVWKVRPPHHFKNKQAHAAWNTRYSGKQVGYTRDDGYVVVRVDGNRVLLHRAIYAIHNGLDLVNVPAEIDHKDNDCANNRPSNLRGSEHRENLANSGAHSNNTSGYKGVSWENRYKRWEVRIRANGKRYHLGYFMDPAEGHAAYVKAANELHGEFARAA